jgi:hypothetical protein
MNAWEEKENDKYENEDKLKILLDRKLNERLDMNVIKNKIRIVPNLIH